MKKSKTSRNFKWIGFVFCLLIYTFFDAFLLSYGGYAISAHMGICAHSTANISEICTNIKISKRNYSIRKYGNSRTKVYDFYLSNGKIYRICCDSLQDNGFTDEQLQSLEGSVVTIEYVATRMGLEAYPLLSIQDENGIVISQQIALKYWKSGWRGTCCALYLGCGVSIVIVFCNLIFIIVRNSRQKARARRKKARRKLQLEERMKKTGTSKDDSA